MNNIKKELYKIFAENPDIIGTGYGKKITNNLVTEEKCLSFGVKKKLPLGEVSPENLIPSEIEIDGVIYKTDVTELGEIRNLACSIPSTCYDCYDPNPQTAIPCATNSTNARPIKGGTIFQLPGGYGTLGFFAVHTPTQAIVAITNAHVASLDEHYLNAVTGGSANGGTLSFYNYTNRRYLGVPYFNNYSPAYSTLGLPAHIEMNSTTPYVNRIDAAMVAVKQYDLGGAPFITNAESWKQIGLSDIPGGINTPPTFASTQELDALLDFTDLEVWSSGARTGVKKGECGLKVVSDDYLLTFYVGNFFDTLATYDNTIQLSRSDASCVCIAGGDSGSALMGKVPTYNPADPNWKNGTRTWKILGLIFAGGQYSATENYGIACRIDHIAEKLQIEAWDGSPKHFLNVDNMDYKLLEGAILDNPKTIDGKEYWQLGTVGKQLTIFS